MLALLLSALWLSACAYVMTVCLDRFGCATGISSTVMGLTVGAVGTSFPNLYASILTAVAGQAGMSICQAFGSNTFNICICLGLVWLLETVVGQCEFGSYTTMTQSVWGWCAGCYLPVGLAPLCPFDTAVGADLIAGSLTGIDLSPPPFPTSTCHCHRPLLSPQWPRRRTPKPAERHKDRTPIPPRNGKTVEPG